ncbi:MAG: TIGR00282 family metallophosphoesterase [candidate division WS1 bacterium]|jgi:metallophosphoesterase (TIGR00282 family)|nr:TIGR00282 family metallophosphoesterase [candidate division WS1 bacterium]
MVIIHVGDVVGKPGRRAISRLLPGLVKEHQPALVIVNGENVAGGSGITISTAEELFAAGADVITTGNHVWTQREAEKLIAKDSRVLRPANYPPGTPGSGAGVFPVRSGAGKVGVVCMLGRVFMRELDCPFRGMDEIIEWMRHETSIIVVDLHAEATSEKNAFSRYLDGRVSAVLGTHTHVQTADERILPGGTAHITDVGMTGATESIIGVEIEPVLKRFVTQMPARFDPPKSGPVVLCGAVLEVDPESGRTWQIKRINEEL